MPGFFDTSALAKLYHAEEGTQLVEEWLYRDKFGFVSRLSLVEMQSMFAGKLRSRAIDRVAAETARFRFRADIRSRRFQVAAVKSRHLEAAEKLVEQHGEVIGLRTLDAIQLAVGMELFSLGAASSFVTADRILAQAAEAEGLLVLNPSIR